MAESPAHKFGQIIGDALEGALRPLLEKFARTHNLYLDMKGYRPCRRGRKCSWRDHNGNLHDLDYVLERGGAPDTPGQPVAFIETAWRRYTKHSRNKAQEIQGAIEPLAETYRHVAPFKGAILAGVFTEGALDQLRSLGFIVLYFPYESVIKVFEQFGIDAKFDEATSDREFRRKIRTYQHLPLPSQKRLRSKLLKSRSHDVDVFFSALKAAVHRQIEHVIVLALHGEAHEVSSIQEAISFVDGYAGNANSPVNRLEIEIRYNNGNSITGRFYDKASAIEFLKGFEPPIQIAE